MIFSHIHHKNMKSSSTIIKSALDVLNIEISGVKLVKRTFDSNFVAAIKELSKTKGRVIITGIGKSGHIANKIASKIARTYTNNHGLKDLCKDLLGVEISKKQQSSDWGSSNLSKEQIAYAANDVIYLHQLKNKLDEMLVREDRQLLVDACLSFLSTRVDLDLRGWENDIFSHSS